MNKQSNTKKYNLGSKGFTLVELLAVIALLAIISVIIVYSAVNVISNAKQKSYDVSISNIEKQAGNYAIENQNDFMWLDVDNDSTSTKQYFCVSVQDLIDTGYFKNDVLDSYIKEGVTVNGTDNIYLERDRTTKTLEKNILLSSTDENYNGLCGNISINGNIRFNVEPSGWAKKKEVTITYKLLNNPDNIGNYIYSYIFENRNDDELEFEDNFNNKMVVEKITITENGVLNATINDVVNKTLEINTIDNNGPEIVVNVENGTIYSKNKKAEIILVDNESGFKSGNYNIYYKWSMSDMSCEQLKSSGEKATLVVEDNNSNTSSLVDVNIDKETGAGKLYVCGDNITDYVGNEMGDTVTTKDVLLDNKEPVVLLGTYNGDSEVNRNVTIPIVVTDDHSGVNGSTFDLSYVKVSVGGTELTSGVVLNKVSDNNYNLVITNSINNGKVKIIVKQNGIYDKAGNGNQEKTLEPDIEFKNIYKISYNNNGGTGSMTDTECIYGENCTLRANTFIRTGYTFLGWSTDLSSTTETYQNGYTYKPFNQTNNITLYAVWKANTYTITYNSGDLIYGKGNVSKRLATNGHSNGKFTYSISNDIVTATGNSSDSFGYIPYRIYLETGKTYIFNSNSSGSWGSQVESFLMLEGNSPYYRMNSNNNYKFSVTQSGTYWVRLDVNNANEEHTFSNLSISYDIGTQTKKHGTTLNLITTKPTRNGYKFLGWSTSKNATTKEFDSGGSYSLEGDRTLYAVWEKSDKTPPTCNISVNFNNNELILNATYSDTGGSEIAYYGWDSYYADSNINTKTVSGTGSVIYYVKDKVGNTNSCSIDIGNATESHTCSKSAKNYKSIGCNASNFNSRQSACTASGYYYNSNSCSKGYYYMRQYRVCSLYKGEYTFRSSEAGAYTSCNIESPFTCNASNYGETYVYGCKELTDDEYAYYKGTISCYYHYCGTGTRDGDYCYLYNQTSCDAGWDDSTELTCSNNYTLINGSKYCYKNS